METRKEFLETVMKMANLKDLKQAAWIMLQSLSIPPNCWQE
jgi:hypothetical protein